MGDYRQTCSTGRVIGPLLIVTDGVVWSVCRSVTIVSPAKTAELIEMPFGLWARMGSGDHIIDGVQRSPPCQGAI